MARKRKFPKKSGNPNLKRSGICPEAALNLPTAERMLQGGLVIRSNRAQATDPLRIDRMLKNGVIDEMQHLHGIRIVTLWNIAKRPFLKAMAYEAKSAARLPDFAHINLSRMSAEDQFYKVMAQLRPRDHELIRRICFEEQGALEAGRAMGLAINAITTYARAAFDALGEALAATRKLKREMEREKEAE